jgi:hypothetical protein
MVLNRRKLMRRKLGVLAVILLGVAAMAMGLSRTWINAQEPKTDKAGDLKKLAGDGKMSEEVKASVDTAVYGKVYSAWPRSDGSFYLGVMTADGKVHGFLFNTGDLKADAIVKAILMAQEKQLRVGAYDDPKTKMLGGFCVFNP